MVSRRAFLQTTAVGAIAGQLLAPTDRAQANPLPVQPQPSPNPNILFVLMDNLGYGELGSYGGGVLRGAPTARIDRLATEGLRLTNFNVKRSAPRADRRCSPAVLLFDQERIQCLSPDCWTD